MKFWKFTCHVAYLMSKKKNHVRIKKVVLQISTLIEYTQYPKKKMLVRVVAGSFGTPFFMIGPYCTARFMCLTIGF